jgi:hypothetical protein
LSQDKVAAQMASAVAAPPGLFVFDGFLVNGIANDYWRRARRGVAFEDDAG